MGSHLPAPLRLLAGFSGFSWFPVNSRSGPSYTLRLPDSSFCHIYPPPAEENSAFKGSCVLTEPIQTVQDNLPILKSVTLIAPAKCLWPECNLFPHSRDLNMAGWFYLPSSSTFCSHLFPQQPVLSTHPYLDRALGTLHSFVPHGFSDLGFLTSSVLLLTLPAPLP